MLLIEKLNYKLIDHIMSKEESFTLNEIFYEIKEKGIVEDKNIIKKFLEKLRDRGVLVEYGSRYSVYRRYF